MVRRAEPTYPARPLMAITIRKHDSRAAVLYFLGGAVRTLAVLLYLPASSMRPVLYWGALGFTLAVYVAIGVGVGAGHRWAKFLLVAAVAWQVVKQLFNLVGSTNPRGATTLELLALALEVVAAVITLKDLFTRAATAKKDI